MKYAARIFVVLWSFLAISLAHAGTITMTVTTASGACQAGCSKTYTDTDANLAKIPTSLQASCNAVLGTTCTTAQVMSFWFDQTIAGVVSQVTGFDKANLASSATSGYVPINPH